MAIWNALRIAATKIPWGVVAEHAPAVMDMVKNRGRSAAPAAASELEELLLTLTAENERLAKELAHTTSVLQDALRRIDAITTRQFTLTSLSVLALIFSVSAFVIAALR